MRAKDALGVRGERIAEGYLLECGHRVLDRNWRCERGELDLVTGLGNELVFTEVKARSSMRAGHPLEAVTGGKLARLRLLAGMWRAAHPDVPGRMRLDVIGVLFVPGEAPRLWHVRGVG